ncbi:TetR/AcrR family transcriptional regulator [Streptomyces sp. NPDC018964]|uniref:TetR/AcrR family transcriptional regulator n=1 Tax=unclassified Streptomyces TaxID=2593676 RepID=UPI0037A3DE3F
MDENVSTRDRLLVVGADLLQAAQGGDVTTRAITQAAGVQAPTLYHHFGSKQGLLDEVVSHGFHRFLEERRTSPSSDPIQAIAQAWDTHVRFGVEHPAFYAHLYARVEPGYKCGVVSQVELMLFNVLEGAADQLVLPPADAAKTILAASSGVVITMISELNGTVDWSLSDRVRDAILASLIKRTTTS